MCAYLRNNYETLLCRKLPQAHDLKKKKEIKDYEFALWLQYK